MVSLPRSSLMLPNDALAFRGRARRRARARDHTGARAARRLSTLACERGEQSEETSSGQSNSVTSSQRLLRKKRTKRRKVLNSGDHSSLCSLLSQQTGGQCRLSSAGRNVPLALRRSHPCGLLPRRGGPLRPIRVLRRLSAPVVRQPQTKIRPPAPGGRHLYGQDRSLMISS